MRKLLLALALLLFAGPAGAVDNYTVTQGSGLTLGCKLVGSVCYTEHMLVDSNGNVIATLSIAGGVTQNGTWTVQPGNTANTTPWLMNIVNGVTQSGTWSVTCSNCSGTTPTNGGSALITGVIPVTPGFVPVQAFNYAYNPSTGRYDAMNLDGFENLKVSGGVTLGTSMGQNLLGSPVLSLVATPGSYPNYSASTVQLPTVTIRGETIVASGLNPLSVSVAQGVTGATSQGSTTSGVGGIPMLYATISAPSNLTAAQLNIATITTSGAQRMAPTAEAWGGANSFHLNGGTANSTNSTLISTGPHTVYNVVVLATTTTAGFFRPYDSATAPNCASATGALDSVPVPVPSATPNAAGYTIDYGPVGMAVTNGLGFCFTGAGADNDNTASGNTGVYIGVRYK